jgi:hypothetical protein
MLGHDRWMNSPLVVAGQWSLGGSVLGLWVLVWVVSCDRWTVNLL